jgi:hypothetical protein
MFRVVRHVGSERGATLVESVFALPLFLGLLIVTFELLLVGYNVLSLQFVLTTAMRESAVHHWSSTELKDNVVSSLRKFGVPLKFTEGDRICLSRVDTWTSGCNVIVPGGSEDLMVLSAEKRIAGVFMLKAFGSIMGLTAQRTRIRGVVLGRNEPR